MASPTRMLNIAIVEDDQEFRDVLQQFLSSQEGFRCELACGSMEEFLGVLPKNSVPDIVMMDIGLPGMSGISGMALIKDQYPEVGIIMLTIYHDSDKIFNALRAGASGYLLKNTRLDAIRSAIEDLHSGGAPMSPQIARKVITFFNNPAQRTPKKSILTLREKEIVSALVDGLSYKMVADRLHISIETVRYHIKNIYEKLHVHSKAEVITKSLRGEI